MVLVGLSFVVSKFPPVIAAAIGFHLVVLMLISVIDIEHRLILSIVLLPAFLIAFLEIVITRRITIPDALVGYAVAQIVVMLYYLMGILYLRIVNARRKDPVSEIAFGFGDVSLATFCGLIVGYPRVVYMLILMALVGGLMAFSYLIVRLVIVRRYEAHMAFAYGPAITIAAAIMLLWGDQVAYYLLGGR
jgi:prepilin signal peptidase PulO-like enzyme (type II secretory pathway)